MDALTTFTDRREFERAAALLDKLSIEHTLISPDPAHGRVGCPAIALTAEGKAQFLEEGGIDSVCAAWVDFRPPAQAVPPESPQEFAEDVVGRIAIVVLAPCVADLDRLRPPALGIYKRLPGTDCKQCGEATCTAFAWAVWRSDADPRCGLPVFEGERGDLTDALVTICSGLGS